MINRFFFLTIPALPISHHFIRQVSTIFSDKELKISLRLQKNYNTLKYNA